MADNHIEWLSDAECRQMERELGKKESRDHFFEYDANSMTEYQRLRMEVAQHANDIQTEAEVLAF